MSLDPGERLALLRTQRGWKQHELGKRAGIVSSSVSKHESGEAKLKIDVVAKYAKAFGLSTEKMKAALFGTTPDDAFQHLPTPSKFAPVGSASAGNGHASALHNLTEGIERVEVGADGLRAYRIMGLSMLPVIPPGAVVKTESLPRESWGNAIGKSVVLYHWNDEEEALEALDNIVFAFEMQDGCVWPRESVRALATHVVPNRGLCRQIAAIRDNPRKVAHVFAIWCPDAIRPLANPPATRG